MARSRVVLPHHCQNRGAINQLRPEVLQVSGWHVKTHPLSRLAVLANHGDCVAGAPEGVDRIHLRTATEAPNRSQSVAVRGKGHGPHSILVCLKCKQLMPSAALRLASIGFALP